MKPIFGMIALLSLSGCALYDSKAYPKNAPPQSAEAYAPVAAPILPVEEKHTQKAPPVVVSQQLPSPADMAVPLPEKSGSAAATQKSRNAGPTRLAPKALEDEATLNTPAAENSNKTVASIKSSDFSSLLTSLKSGEDNTPQPAPSFVWPLQGEIITDFGPQADGTRYDGLKIAGPKGAPLRAAAAGTVIYADNKLPAYGNLVIIRHEGGWLSAYGHLDRMLVAQDNLVAAGDLLGTLGSSKAKEGSAPALHFEIRQGEKPVDPVPLLPPADMGIN